jgi:hypothetical protein
MAWIMSQLEDMDSLGYHRVQDSRLAMRLTKAKLSQYKVDPNGSLPQNLQSRTTNQRIANIPYPSA